MPALQIRDVPDDLRDVLAEQARRRGQSMQAYLLELISREARAARNADAYADPAHAAARVALPDDVDLAAVVREGRDAGFAVDRS